MRSVLKNLGLTAACLFGILIVSSGITAIFPKFDLVFAWLAVAVIPIALFMRSTNRGALSAAAFLVCVFSSQMAASEGDRFTFKGVTPGMKLEEFRSLEFPDAGKHPDDGKPIPRAYRTQCQKPMELIRQCWFEAWNETYPPICTKNEVEIAEHVREVNSVSRRYRLSELTENEVREMCFKRIDVGYGGWKPKFGSDVSYYFFDGRLVEINIFVRPGTVNLLYPKLEIAYGPPSWTKRPIEQNRLGASFGNLFVTWENSDDIIVLKRYDGSTDIGRFSFIHKQTSALFRASKARKVRDAAKDF